VSAALPDALAAEPFAAIRSACAEVAARATRVRIDAERLPAYARELAASPPRGAGEGPWQRLDSDAELRAAFVLMLDGVNFGSGFFPHLRKPPGHSGYRTIEAGLLALFEQGGAPSAAELRSTTAQRCAAIFGQKLEPPVDELMEWFARAWRELGELIQGKFGGRFAQLAEAAEGRASGVVRTLLRAPMFADVSRYAGRPVPLLKRAQIAAADLASALDHTGFRLTDLEEMTLFADNLVPHVLRLDGVLRFDPELVARIEREELLQAGSPEEVEIRACAVHAVELLSAATRAHGTPLWPYQLDNVLWNRGGGPIYKARPRHRARCWFY
jgi:hypothetical protein